MKRIILIIIIITLAFLLPLMSYAADDFPKIGIYRWEVYTEIKVPLVKMERTIAVSNTTTIENWKVFRTPEGKWTSDYNKVNELWSFTFTNTILTSFTYIIPPKK